jgi:putative CocE/NonD family hydrolase
MNQWRKFESWPPQQGPARTIYLEAKGKLSWQPAATQTYDEYVSDPNRPVPYVSAVSLAVRNDYMTEDQRFAATRPDVLVYKTDRLDHDITVFGSIAVDLKVSTTGTDSDFDVKLIDVYPGDYPDFNNPPPPATPGTVATPVISQMGGYQQLIRGEPFRGKYRKGFERPVPFEPGKPDRIAFMLPDVAHTFRAGHRIMIQVQSSWFPLTDRNPQKFMEIPKAQASDFSKATQRVFLGGPDGSRIQFMIAE